MNRTSRHLHYEDMFDLADPVPPAFANAASVIACAWLLRRLRQEAVRTPLEQNLVHLAIADLGCHGITFLHILFNHAAFWMFYPDVTPQTCLVFPLSRIIINSPRNMCLFASAFVEILIAVTFLLHYFQNSGTAVKTMVRCLPLVWPMSVILMFAVRCEEFEDDHKRIRLCIDEGVLLKRHLNGSVVAQILIKSCLWICLSCYVLAVLASVMLGRRSVSKRAKRYLCMYPLNYVLSFGPMVLVNQYMIHNRGDFARGLSNISPLLFFASMNGFFNATTYAIMLWGTRFCDVSRLWQSYKSDSGDSSPTDEDFWDDDSL